MIPPEEGLEELAGAVLDGDAVEWAGQSSDPRTQSLLRQLRLVASVARLHREVLPSEAPGEWGHLRLLERVGRGSFGDVYRAWDTRLDREVALKLMPATPATGGAAPSAIISEGRLLARVRHPNVVTIYGAEQIDDRIGLWMEFVRGATLEQQLRQGHAFAPAEILQIGIELCAAVTAVHAAGLLHRDIKAHNVMRADDGRIMLMDFGTGRELDDGSATDVAGTPLYLAPESFRGGPATATSDVYSIGVLLFHLATGGYPVNGRSVGDLREAHSRGERASLREGGSRISAGLARIVEQASDPKPGQRFPTAAALGAALTAFQRHERQRPWLYAAAATVTLALAGVAGWARFASEATEPPQPTTVRNDIALPAPPAVPPEQPASVAPPPKSAPVRVRPAGMRPSVRVMPLVNATGRGTDAWLSATLAEMVLREFRGSEAFRWIPGEVPLAKAQLGLAMGYTSSMDIRPVTGADVIVSGEYRVWGPSSAGPLGGLAVSLKIEDVGAGLAPTTLAEKGATEDLIGLVGRLGARARASLGAAPLTPEQSAALVASQPATAAAARAYAEGLAKVAPDAVESAEEAIARDPAFAPAYLMLAEGSYFRRGPPCTVSSPPDCVTKREHWVQKTAAAAAKARELSATLPREERMLIELRAQLTEVNQSAAAPDYARLSRQLFTLFPDTVTYGFWVARAQMSGKDAQGALATVDAISQLPDGRQDLFVLNLEVQLARGSRDFKRAARALEQSWALAAPASDPRLRAEIRADQAFVARELGELRKAQVFGEEAARLYTAAANEVGLQQVRGTLASIYRALGDFARARTTYEQRIAFENARNPLGPAERNIRYNLAIELFHHGDLADARGEFEQVIRETGSKPLPYIPCAKVRLGVVLHRLGDLPAARRFVDEVLAANPKDRSQCQGESGRVFFEQGELDQARALSNELAVLTRIALAAGDPDRARAMVQEALPIPTNPRVFLSSAFLTGAFEVAMVQARIALEEGRASDARREAEQAVKLAREDFRPDDEAAAEAVFALAWLAEGRLREAQQAIARLEKRLTVTQDRLLRLSGGISVARVQAASKRPDQVKVARQRLETLIREAADIGAVAIAFEARLALGEIEITAGDVPAGRARLEGLARDATAKGFVNTARKAAVAARVDPPRAPARLTFAQLDSGRRTQDERPGLVGPGHRGPHESLSFTHPCGSHFMRFRLQRSLA